MFNTTLFPFAFNPENVEARELIHSDDNTITMKFDMSVQNAPECAAIAVIFDEPKHFDSLRFHFTFDGEPLKITTELKSQNVIKFREQTASSDGIIEFLNIEKEVKEIVFCCWRANNPNKKGTVKITKI